MVDLPGHIFLVVLVGDFVTEELALLHLVSESKSYMAHSMSLRLF